MSRRYEVVLRGLMNGFNRLNGKSVKARLWEVSVLGTLRSFFLRGR